MFFVDWLALASQFLTLEGVPVAPIRLRVRTQSIRLRVRTKKNNVKLGG